MKQLFLILACSVGLLYGQCNPIDLPVDIDLEQLAQNYVLEVKQLHISGHSTACNPSIVRWRDRLILSFDAYSKGKEDQPDLIGLVTLDTDFNMTSQPQILEITKNLWQDPRLITLQDRLYAVFNGAIDDGTRRMFIAEIFFDGENFAIDTPQPLLYFPGAKVEQWERNWVPFVFDNAIFLTYSLLPHRILRPIPQEQKCEEIATTDPINPWSWGTPKPGTSGYLDGDHYLAFFHSIKVMATSHSNGIPIQHYFMGAYTFEKYPPFRVTAISQSPIIGKNFYNGPEYTMIKPCRAVFPCGFIFDEEFVWVVFGRQDHEIWMVKLAKGELYSEMRSIGA